MRIEFKKKATKHDALSCARSDGTTTHGEMYRLSILPHDLIHYVVETKLGLKRAFFGQLESGWNIEDYLVKEKRKEIPVEALQVELIVAVIQFSYPRSIEWTFEEFMEAAELACENFKTTAPAALDKKRHAEIIADVKKYNALWQSLPVNQSLKLTF